MFSFLAYFSFLRKENYEITMLSVCPFQRLKKITDFHEIWYERYDIRGHLDLVLYDFLQSLITIWRAHKFV